jgi:hypothetical protein
MWTALHCLISHSTLERAGASLKEQVLLFEGLVGAHVPETLESYGAGLTRFHQFCDRHDVTEDARMPASRQLLALFVSEARGTCTGSCIRNWLCGLRLWHIYNDAPWFGDDKRLALLKKSSVKAGLPFSCPACGPVTPAHLHAFLGALDPETPYGAAMGSLALTAFGGCCRLGELVLRSAAKFDLKRDTCRKTCISDLVVNGRDVRDIKLVWTKTTQTAGGQCLLTARTHPDIDICPVRAFDIHRRVNHSPPPGTPLFAYRSTLGWRVITKHVFLAALSLAFKNAGLDQVFGHSYCIGGAMDLLLAGVVPEVIMKLGGWTSLCFLVYWRRLERVIPTAIARAWAAQQKEFARAHNHPLDLDVDSLDFL